MPVGPVTIVVHMASVWVPFSSEAKEAIAHYQEITKEIKLALQEVGRKMQRYVHKKVRMHQQLERASIFERYIPEVARSLAELSGEKEAKILQALEAMVKKEDIQREILQMETLNSEFEGPEKEKGEGEEEE